MSSAPLTGRLVAGRYRIGSLLGEGGMGAVYEAVQEDLGRPVAIKVMHENLQVATEALARFQREAKAAASLGHPNIAQVTDFGADEGRAYLVMDRLPGASLASILEREGRLSPDRACGITVQLLSALEAAHGAGFVHRDIKPDNIFIVPMAGVGEIVKVLDFGVAKLLDEANAEKPLTALGQILGSPAYMAPEQVRALPVDARADIFAVGATMYRALSGALPFDVATLAELVRAIVSETPKPLEALAPGIDPNLDAIVAKAMQKDPNARFASAREMREAVERIRPALGASGSHAAASSAQPASRSSTSTQINPARPRTSTEAIPIASVPQPVPLSQSVPQRITPHTPVPRAPSQPSPPRMSPTPQLGSHSYGVGPSAPMAPVHHSVSTAMPPGPEHATMSSPHVLTVEKEARLRAAGYDTDGTKALKLIGIVSLVIVSAFIFSIIALAQYCTSGEPADEAPAPAMVREGEDTYRR
ncbi:MAG: protein kinase [Planctomycetes bacterium]|nr:protein kinase [Planctomycetota bacterium]